MKGITLSGIGLLACLVASPLAAEQTGLLPALPVQDAEAATAPAVEDNANLMQEVCADLAADEGKTGTALEDYVKECLSSMTTDLGKMQDATTDELGDTERAQTATPTDLEAAHPETLVADELVDKPAPGAEELVPK